MFCCPNCFRPGRTFLAADAPAGEALPAEPLKWIDVHCHIFNARDLPMDQFINQTRINLDNQWLLRSVAATLVAGLQSSAPTAQDEITQLGQGGEGTAAVSLPTHDVLTRTAATARAPLLREISNSMDGAATSGDVPLSDVEIRRLAQHIDDSVDLADVVAWANSFSQARNRMVTSLLSQFGSRDKVLLTPSLVDYNRWLGIAADSGVETMLTRPGDQLAVLETISRKRAREDGRPLFTLAPFDPWRFIEDQANGRETILDIAAPYIARGSVVGFKVYPPMGFGAAGNAARPDNDFPPALQDLVGHGVGARLDAAMTALFDACIRDDLPIQAHCGNTNYPRYDDHPGWDGRFSAPEFWQPALAAHPGLRVNLGHFGGVWAFGASARANASADDQREQDWARDKARAIAVLMSGNNPNLYADIAFADTLLRNPNDAEAAETRLFLAELIDEFPILRQRLMYGSDWIMVGNARFGDAYARTLTRHVGGLFPGAEMERFRWANAAGFLGLGQGGKTRERMTRFLHDAGADATVLDEFDPALLGVA